ncbi:Flp pilus assembly protein TadG [Brevundimonas variabilis]|uniref:Flp pilus assembly protein TadG n=2 Tax=Brevundimonas variabilis TaxID=74312 RepID=A0A7W9CL75_9CAUL|nr:Flp pilus assembly protein TadG [Brevundimonas variabilis]
MVAAPFFFMLFAILELGLVFVTDSTMENAVQETGRLVRTGQAQASAMSAQTFKDEVCERMSLLANDCTNRTTIDVRVIDQFRDVNPPDPMADGETFDDSELVFQTGQPGSLILVRVWYEQPLITPFLSEGLSRLGNGEMVMTATTTFRNEPY